MQQDSGETKGSDYQHEQQSAPLRCPRCDSANTKFRYYNNHDRRQPRHYCKTCRRYWTVGGSMRNVPLGGSRRNGKPAEDSSSLYSRISVSLVSSSRLQHPIIPPASSCDEVSCLAAMQSLTQPPVAFSLNQPLPQHLPSFGANPNWPMMIDPLSPQDFKDNLSFAAANASIWSSSNGNTNDSGTATTSMNLNYWPRLPDHRGLP